jgi:hypothetical protein
MRNDEKLVRLGYLQAVTPGTRLETCGTCGAQFLDAHCANAHHTERHQPKVKPTPKMEARRTGETQQEYELRERQWREALAAQEEAEDTRAEERENSRAPLYLENTTASRT